MIFPIKMMVIQHYHWFLNKNYDYSELPLIFPINMMVIPNYHWFPHKNDGYSKLPLIFPILQCNLTNSGRESWRKTIAIGRKSPVKDAAAVLSNRFTSKTSCRFFLLIWNKIIFIRVYIPNLRKKFLEYLLRLGRLIFSTK